jgi:hypothetical protein
MPLTDKPKMGTKVKVTDHIYGKYMENFKGKEGRVDGAITHSSCIVKLKNGQRRWFDYRELDLI